MNSNIFEFALNLGLVLHKKDFFFP